MKGRFILAALTLGLASCSNDAAVPEKPKDQPVAVRVAQVQRGDAATTVKTAGTVAWREETALSFTTAGRIARIYVNEGDRVRKGQLLAQLDTTPVTAALDVARAEQVRAQAEFRRLEPLMAKGWVTRPRYEAAQAAADAADAAVRARRFSLDTARIVASSDGVVLSRSAEPGQVIDDGMPVLVLGKGASGFVLRAPLNDREAVRIGQGAAATVVLEALEGRPLTGTVLEIGGRADRATGTFQVEIALPADARLRSGQIGRADIASATADPGRAAPTLVPPLALFGARAGDAFVYVVDAQNTVRARKVQVGETTDSGAAILAGLAPGDWVAVSALDQLRDGAVIRPDKRTR